MPQTLRRSAIEESTYIVTVAIADDGGNAVAPNTALWTLSDAQGNIVNSRSAVSLTPSTSMAIVLHGDDLALTGYDGPVRKLLVYGTYDSTAGSGLEYKDEATFSIDDLVNVS